jgi:7-keto-8-aminopelargonate synthetase-like enzyme
VQTLWHYVDKAAQIHHSFVVSTGHIKHFSVSRALVDPLHLIKGTTKLRSELEELAARFVGKPAAVVFGMGYVTNSAIIPRLIGKVWWNAMLYTHLTKNVVKLM